MTQPEPQYMLQLELDPKRLMTLGKMLGLPPQVDTGYLVHCALGELFQQQAPCPFFVQSSGGQGVHVLAYSTIPHDALLATAQAFASPHVYNILKEVISKPLPTTFGAKMRLGFQLYACPVVRAHQETEHHRKGAEIDAFLAYCERHNASQDDEHSRSAAYLEWLKRQFAQRLGAELVQAQLRSFNLVSLYRRDAGRKAHRLSRRPAVSFEGTLEVTSPEDFLPFLTSSFGRHSSFGFGMMMLRRASR